MSVSYIESKHNTTKQNHIEHTETVQWWLTEAEIVGITWRVIKGQIGQRLQMLLKDGYILRI